MGRWWLKMVVTRHGWRRTVVECEKPMRWRGEKPVQWRETMGLWLSGRGRGRPGRARGGVWWPRWPPTAALGTCTMNPCMDEAVYVQVEKVAAWRGPSSLEGGGRWEEKLP